MFGDRHWVTVKGHGAVLEAGDGHVYMALALRNAGSGPAVLHSWFVTADPDWIGAEPPPLELFKRQMRDIYVPAGDLGFWQGRIRDGEDDQYADLAAAAADSDRLVSVFLVYGDHEGGQRTIARFSMVPEEHGDGREGSVTRYWNLDRDDPR